MPTTNCLMCACEIPANETWCSECIKWEDEPERPSWQEYPDDQDQREFDEREKPWEQFNDDN